jgi:diadenosine tetraphosphatase ApaH/serine/threonine PP2A family protein phosphatase
MGVDEAGAALSDGRPGRVALPTSRRMLINPGSVGQSRDDDPRARAAIVDVTEGYVEFCAVSYDLAAARGALRLRGLPQDTYQLRPGRGRLRSLREVLGYRGPR